jgi:hypothetical protein
MEKHNPDINNLKPPAEMSGFCYMMIWHPRVNTDAAHAWQRASIRQVGASR